MTGHVCAYMDSFSPHVDKGRHISTLSMSKTIISLDHVHWFEGAVGHSSVHRISFLLN